LIAGSQRNAAIMLIQVANHHHGQRVEHVLNLESVLLARHIEALRPIE
jgi:hypothetical protein